MRNNKELENKIIINKGCTRCGGNHSDFYCFYHKVK